MYFFVFSQTFKRPDIYGRINYHRTDSHETFYSKRKKMSIKRLIPAQKKKTPAFCS